MPRFAKAVFLLAVFACAQGRSGFEPPDGKWWLAASQAQRNGFYVGYMNCGIREAKSFPIGISGYQIQDAVTDHFRRYPGDDEKPVSSIIFALESGWQRTGAYHFVRAEPGNEWDGDYWRTNQDERVGIVLGFLACEFAEGKAVSGRPGQELVSWVDQFYGVDPTGKNPDQLGPRYKEKLSTAIMAAERALP